MDKPGKLRKLQNNRSYEEQFRSLYKVLFQDLFVYAKSITKSEDLAKDAVAEVFVKLWDSKADLSKIREVRSYLLVAAKNESIKLLNHSNRFGELDVSRQIEIVNPEEILLEKELKELIDQVVASLPGQCQLIFMMNSRDRKSYKEIAAELNVTVSTVGTQVSRAIHAIRTEITSRYRSNEDDNLGYIAKTIFPLVAGLVHTTSL